MIALAAMPPVGGPQQRSEARTAAAVDRWSKWWSRLSQVAGLALAGYEIVLRPGGAQDGVLLFCAAMMLGPIGLRILLRGVADVAGLADAKIERQEERDDA